MRRPEPISPEQAYGVVGSEVMPLLEVLAVIYVAWYAVQLRRVGPHRRRRGRRPRRAHDADPGARQPVGHFNSFFYSWLNDTPEDVGRAILAASSTGITEPDQRAFDDLENRQ